MEKVKHSRRLLRGSWGGNNLQNPDVNRSHEPVGIPLNRPPGTFSPTGGEGRDEGARSMGWAFGQYIQTIILEMKVYPELWRETVLQPISRLAA